jgi:decaprenylphospho-beta-D-erythro-pentofuranosid-2-ulose 2-reductase
MNRGTALLVGGSSQIGMAVLIELLGPPPRRVVLAGRPSEELWENAEKLRDLGYHVTTTQYDAAFQADEIEGMLEHVVADNQLGLAVIAVGSMAGKSFAEGIVVNGLAVAALVEVLVRRMSAAGSGQLVLLSSAAAARPRTAIAAYSLGKQLADSTAVLLAPQAAAAGVRVLVVRPGFVATRMTDGLKPPPLSSTAAQVAQRVAQTLPGKRIVVWVPKPMGLAVWLLRRMPSRLLPEALR